MTRKGSNPLYYLMEAVAGAILFPVFLIWVLAASRKDHLPPTDQL